MTARKKTKTMAARKKTEEYIVLFSDCSEDGQLNCIGSEYGDTVVHSSLTAAKREANEHVGARKDNGESGGGYAIVRIIERGIPGDVAWKAQ